MCDVIMQFAAASGAFRVAPSTVTYNRLLDAAAHYLVERNKPAYVAPFGVREWRAIEQENALCADFGEVRVIVDRYLTGDEVRRVAGCVGYAFRETLAGEDLSEPQVIQSCRAGQTVLLFRYDTTKSRRDDPDFEEAFALAEGYVQDGTPVRKTNRAGAGTKDTRLVEGVGKCRVQFAVR